MFEDLSNIPVSRVDTVIDVVSRGDGTQAQDDVFVTASLGLTGDIDSEEAILILPLASEAQTRPLVRYTDEPIKGAAVFEFDDVERAAYDQEFVDRLEKMADGASKREQRDFAVAVGRVTKSFSVAAISVKPGQRELRLFYKIAADKVGDREFEYEVIGPLPSFVIQGGGSIGVVSLQPRKTTVVSAKGLTDPSNEGSEIAKVEARLGYRQVIGWEWQSDPLFRVRYRYDG
ncbi:MAG TPA: hypothetical protein VFY48_09600 [Solirubrobacterales bacterium]|nr:hypothetical protein [Solirubrobacterales bacterium]